MGAPVSPVTRANPGLVAAAICGLEALVLVGFCGFYLYELVLGEGEDPTRVVMSVVLMGLFAAVLGAAARAWLRGAGWPRTFTIVWNLLLLPVAWSMNDADYWAALPLGLVATAAVVAALLARRAPEPTA